VANDSAALTREPLSCPDCGAEVPPAPIGSEGTVMHACTGRPWRPGRFRGRVHTGAPLGLLGWLGQRL
jgi:hypothetical protein